MRTKLVAACSTLTLLIGLSAYTVVGRAQTAGMARHEPHMSAAIGHLQQAKAELERANRNKGGHRQQAIQLIDQAIQQVQQGEAYDQQHQRH